jgi:hypothetical protein
LNLKQERTLTVSLPLLLDLTPHSKVCVDDNARAPVALPSHDSGNLKLDDTADKHKTSTATSALPYPRNRLVSQRKLPPWLSHHFASQARRRRPLPETLYLPENSRGTFSLLLTQPNSGQSILRVSHLSFPLASASTATIE